jgi:two-component sensor histidine kinase
VSLPLKLEQALPCALILYELITNALRHTGQGQAAPDIEIVTSQPVEGAIHISVRDRGPGPGGWNENIESAKTLGLTIVRALVKQLRGHIEFRPGQPGTDIVLTVPAQASPQEKEQHDG